jgi:hypothetical protein
MSRKSSITPAHFGLQALAAPENQRLLLYCKQNSTNWDAKLFYWTAI